MPDLLLELFSEEIPARMQARACADLQKLVTDGLVEAGLTYAGAAAFATPRRLALTVQGLTAASPRQREDRKGPRADAPEAAIAGFLRSTGISRDQLEVRGVGKAAVLFAVTERPGRPAAEIVAEVVTATIRNFPWPKSMRWGNGTLRWVRPLQSILCILSDEAGAVVVPFEVEGIGAGNTTAGHRFMAPARFAVTGFDDYAARLKRAFVVLDGAERAAHIAADAANAAFALGLEVVEDAALLAEVAGLVEWPVVLTGRIGEAFLDLPPEVLQTSMRAHQKFFSLKNPRTGRIERFATVANIATPDNGAVILAGNQKVLAARLSDAKFFWENDLRVVSTVGLKGMAAGLADVTFHNKLGSEADRVARIAALAREIAPMVGADPGLAEQAALVVKADLQSAMVGEFPELQGLMGSYYARHAGLPEAVALACRDHRAPQGPSDAVPTDPLTVAVALADKIDTLTHLWTNGERATGSGDRFAQRRTVLGVLRIILRNNVDIKLLKVFSEVAKINPYMAVLAKQEINEFDRRGNAEAAIRNLISECKDIKIKLSSEKETEFNILARSIKKAALVRNRRRLFEAQSDRRTTKMTLLKILIELKRCKKDTADAPKELLAFLHDRLKGYLREQGIRHDIIDACLAMPANDDLTLLVKRAEALNAFLQTPDGEPLLQGFKRANNILTAEEKKDGVEYSLDPDVKFAESDTERALFAALDHAETAIKPAIAAEDFAAAMRAMAALRAPVDAFFDAHQVNAASQIIRRNRLCLMHRIRAICGQVADLTKLDG